MMPPLNIIPSLGVYAASALTIFVTISDVFVSNKANVAFVGNSFQYYNDLPRLMEAISGGRISQDSCLRSASTISSIWMEGNGMDSIFNSSEALDEYGEYDIGSPDVETLLLGNTTPGVPKKWNFVVMNDRTFYPASNDTRMDSVYALQKLYLPLFQKISARPVFISTHAFRKATRKSKRMGINVTDVLTYTHLVKEGYLEYASVLHDGLGDSQSPLIAPVGDAFLTVWEEDPELWESLFDYDGRHPSPHGTYLQAIVLHCTLFGKAPPRDVAIPSDPSVLFERARVMEPNDVEPLPIPTYEEAKYLYNVAEWVTLKSHLSGAAAAAYAVKYRLGHS